MIVMIQIYSIYSFRLYTCSVNCISVMTSRRPSEASEVLYFMLKFIYRHHLQRESLVKV